MKELSDTQPATKSEHQKRFEDMARKVFSVPKKEIDRRQTEYEKQRKNEHKHASNGKG
jgi:hypothetical protein